ncbi:hypothetical protein FB45DRAFT_872919 [Roridomyces roridus]|uniref:Peptidase A1 domain-containing protein n=1 Tax=Roridomyces roridus TaxID=1738132 RepID=A0AAD7BC02_9AGAR|nr:hypothetical protein FB45DRAFT_872919 [Roridomyces roridus]
MPDLWSPPAQVSTSAALRHSGGSRAAEPRQRALGDESKNDLDGAYQYQICFPVCQVFKHVTRAPGFDRRCLGGSRLYQLPRRPSSSGKWITPFKVVLSTVGSKVESVPDWLDATTSSEEALTARFLSGDPSGVWQNSVAGCQLIRTLQASTTSLVPNRRRLRSVGVAASGRSWHISAENFNLGRTDTGSSDCVGAVGGLDSGLGDSVWLLGDVFMKNMYTVFDLGKETVGFAELA